MQILGTILRFLFAWIDGVVAKVLTLVYGLLMDLASLRLYSDEIIKIIGQRIGILLGIFMLFRLAVSLINYMISPEKFSDNKQGGAALIKNVIVSLALLATVNTIFETAYIVQDKVVKSQIIEKIFFGETSQTEMDIGYFLYSAFFTPNPEVVSNCNDMWNPTFELATSKCNEELGTVLETNALNSVHDARNHLDMSRVFLNYDLVTANKGGAFKGKMVFDYTPIISTAAGVVALLILISFSMELAKRAIKLLFLQIVAPVPIIFNMDTGKGKDVFQKWTKECINTYISVFIRLLAIDFAVFMIVILKSEFSKLFQDSIGVNVFIIIGSLLFAKEVPKLLENMFGIKMDGMSLHPLKKFQEQALFGKQITGIGAAGVAGAAAFGANALATNGGLFKRLGSGIGGAGSAFTRGTVGALKGQNMGQVYSGAYRGAINARNNRDSRQKLDVSAPSVWLNSFQRKIGADTKAEVQDTHLKMYDEFTSSADSLVSISESEVQKYANKIALGFGAMGSSSGGFATLGELREAMNDTTHYSAAERAKFNQEYENLKGDAEKLYRTYATKGSRGLHDSTEFSFVAANDVNGQTAMAHINNLQDIFDKNKKDEAFKGYTSIDGSNIKDVNKKVKYTSTSVKNSGEYRQAHKVQEQTNREKK